MTASPNESIDDSETPGITADFDLDALFDEQSYSQDENNEFVLELPPIPLNKRPLTPPSESATPATPAKRTKFNQPQNTQPELLLPEHVITTKIINPLFEDDPTTIASIQQMKQRMITAHTLLTTYTALKRTSTQVTSQFTNTRTQLLESNKWRFLLADENARLRSRVSIMSKEKEHLKVAITKLHGDTNGLEKNKALRNEIKEKNVEIERL